MMDLLDQLPVLPVLLPSVTAVLLLLIGDHGGDEHDLRKLVLSSRISIVSALVGLVIAIQLTLQASDGQLMVYRMGEWPAPFGIVLVVDRLSAMMVLLTSLVALPVLLYASGGWAGQGRYFHALFQFQLMGLNGAFVTGDLFNLFVFFEVLLIASYVLMMHGLGRDRLRVGVHYVVLNLCASALFLIGVAMLYALTGTLNMTDLALRAPLVTGPDAVLLQVAALLLLVVFGFKAAMAPLAVWMPATYAASSAPVAALFAIMTKVGVYAIWRVHGVIFGHTAGESVNLVEPLLLPLAVLTSLMGVMGLLAAQTLPRLVAWLTVASVGTILMAVGLFGAPAWSAALYYLAHSTLTVAGLFLLVELVAAQRGEVGGRIEPASMVAQPTMLGLMLLLAAASSIGLPPLPGFIGKLMLLQASAHHGQVVMVWSVVLLVGFLTLMGLARAGSTLFWHVRSDLPSGASGASAPLVLATSMLLALSVAMSVFAAPLQHYTQAAAEQLLDRKAYADAVLGEQGGISARTTRPYTGQTGGKQ